MEIETYRGKYDEEIISLILGIQNGEAGIGLSLEEQPDLTDIARYYQRSGEFWTALDNGKLVGTVGIMLRENNCAVMKKFFVDAEYRRKGVGAALYGKLLDYAKAAGVKHIILDTPSVARASHRFYENAGFRKTEKASLPINYDFPDRNCIVYILDL